MWLRGLHQMLVEFAGLGGSSFVVDIVHG